MSLLVCWLLFGALLALVALGHALALERLAGVRLPAVLLLPAGLALVVVVGELLVTPKGVAYLATPVVVAIALAGLVAGRPLEALRRIERPAVVAALGVFALYAAPIVLSGQPTFAGYIKLDDSATFFALADRAMDHGRDLSGLAPSTYSATLAAYMGTGYPIGSMLPPAILHGLVGQDIAWVYQPWMAFMAAMTALAGYGLVRPLVRRSSAALGAFAAASSALLYGYVLWGGVKEVATAWLLLTLAALIPGLIEGGTRLRRALPVAVVVGATVGTVTIAAGVYVAPMLLVALAARRGRGTARQAAALVALAAVLSVPAIGTAKRFLETSGALTARTELGNLVRPLDPLQLFGVWPAGDFRVSPHVPGLTHFVIVLVAGALGVGLVAALRRRAWGLLAYALGAAVGGSVLVIRGSPWVDAKTLAVLSPGVLLGAFAGFDAVRGRLPVAAPIAVAVVAAVVAGDVLAYHQVALAPRDRLQELERFGRLVEGRGPTLIPVYEPYAGRHFLRAGDPESVSDLRVRAVALRTGGLVPRGGFADLDALQLNAVLPYRSLVVPRGPGMSRPPAPYRRVAGGRWYDLWQRPPRSPSTVIDHVPLDTAHADCAAVGAAAAEAQRSGARLAVAPGPVAQVWPVAGGTSPRALRVRIDAPGVSRIWVGGSFAGDLDVAVDARPVGTVTGLANAGIWATAGVARLSPGLHVFGLRYRRSLLRPGTGMPLARVDALAVTPADDRRPMEDVDPRRWRSLCGRRLDWIEVLRRA